MTAPSLRRNIPRITRLCSTSIFCRRVQQFSSKTRSQRYNNTPIVANNQRVDIDALLAQPTWSVSSLLLQDTPNETSSPRITSKQLHHLLRLSALPPPTSDKEEEKMLSTLQSQLHFVREIQNVDTTDIDPLTSLRDETAENEKESELGVESLREALEAEEVRGRFHPRIRRRKFSKDPKGNEQESWDVLECADKKVGRYFIVENGKD